MAGGSADVSSSRNAAESHQLRGEAAADRRTGSPLAVWTASVPSPGSPSIHIFPDDHVHQHSNGHAASMSADAAATKCGSGTAAAGGATAAAATPAAAAYQRIKDIFHTGRHIIVTNLPQDVTEQDVSGCPKVCLFVLMFFREDEKVRGERMQFICPSSAHLCHPGSVLNSVVYLLKSRGAARPSAVPLDEPPRPVFRARLRRSLPHTYHPASRQKGDNKNRTRENGGVYVYGNRGTAVSDFYGRGGGDGPTRLVHVQGMIHKLQETPRPFLVDKARNVCFSVQLNCSKMLGLP
ncbi:unnamed protein product [Notodromas monacha]|uniref:Uncharacterized protein n=1 Tax=Notodromas monacha TaxID=399045 RepID=A0A7R9BFT0_9CRUS|nr:unnamed protein product [Notodromas monacha]CAG0913694.1 unnamed protein product [Notodromas monacha]